MGLIIVNLSRVNLFEAGISSRSIFLNMLGINSFQAGISQGLIF